MKTPTRHTWSRVAKRLTVGFAVIAGLLYVGRDPLATTVANGLVSASTAVSCRDMEIDIATGLQRITVNNVSCEMASGPLRQMNVEGPLSVQLAGLGIAQVDIKQATVDLRDRDVSHVETNTVGDLMELSGQLDSLYKGLLDASEMYARRTPKVAIQTLHVSRQGKDLATLHDFRKEVEANDWDHSTAARVVPAQNLGPITIGRLDMKLVPPRANMWLEMHLGEDSGAADAELTVRATKLTGRKPHVALSMKGG